jgi:hypothetical protein
MQISIRGKILFNLISSFLFSAAPVSIAPPYLDQYGVRYTQVQHKSDATYNVICLPGGAVIP